MTTATEKYQGFQATLFGRVFVSKRRRLALANHVIKIMSEEAVFTKAALLKSFKDHQETREILEMTRKERDEYAPYFFDGKDWTKLEDSRAPIGRNEYKELDINVFLCDEIVPYTWSGWDINDEGTGSDWVNLEMAKECGEKPAGTIVYDGKYKAVHWACAEHLAAHIRKPDFTVYDLDGNDLTLARRIEQSAEQVQSRRSKYQLELGDGVTKTMQVDLSL